MLKLSSPDLFWIKIQPGVRVQVEPISPATLLLAGQASREALDAGGPDASVNMQVAYTTVLALRGIKAWEGVGDEAGAVLDVPTPETIARLLRDPVAFKAIDTEYAWPVLERQAEKNASAPLPTGSSARAVKPIAATAAQTGRKRAKPAVPAKAAPPKRTGRGATTGS